MKTLRHLSLLPALLLLSSSQEPLAVTPATAAPMVTTLVTGLPGGTGGMEVDAAGFVYSSDFGSKLGQGSTGGNKIFKIDPESGEYTLFSTVQRGASGSAIGPNGDFFQSNIGDSTISRITPQGEVSTFIKNKLQQPVGLIFDEEGTLFVANCGGQRVVEVLPDGESSVLSSSKLFKCPNGIALDTEHNLYICNFGNGDVIKVSPDGEATRFATLPGSNNGHIVYRDEKLYVIARSAHQIYSITLEGKVELVAGSGKRGHQNGPALQATFSYPNDLAFSPDGKTLYINENSPTTGPGSELAPTVVRALQLKE